MNSLVLELLMEQLLAMAAASTLATAVDTSTPSNESLRERKRFSAQRYDDMISMGLVAPPCDVNREQNDLKSLKCS